MFEHYLKATFRNFWRYWGYTLINLFGLAIGIATCLIIFTYISYELNYEKFNEDYEDVFRLAVKGKFGDDFYNVAVSMPPLPVAIKQNFPEVRSYSRINEYEENTFLAIDDKKFYVDGLYFVDTSFLDVFTFELLRGDPATALAEPYSLVLTETIARKYFGQEDPMGMMLRLNDQTSLKVTGILKDIPANTHMKFTMLGSLSTLITEHGKDHFDDNWRSLFLHSYIRLNHGTDPKAFEEKIKMVIRDAFGELADESNIELTPYLQPLASIHLHSNLLAELEPNSDISYVYIFSAVAVFILVIACINFMNLSTARSSKRSREVGMRKVSGATRNQLIWQFLGESLLLSFIGMILALVLVEAFMPFFSNLTDLELEPYFHRPFTLLIVIILAVFVGFFAGTYPAFVLSSFQPIRAIRGELYKGMKKSILRNLLVVLQFTISIALLVSTWLIYKQMNYINEKKMGFEQENLVIVPLKSDRLQEQGKMLKGEFEQLPAVKMISLTSSTPTGGNISGKGYSPEGTDSKAPWILYTLEADDSFIDVFGMKIKDGRKLSREYGTDTMATVINEAMVKKLGWEDPVGKKIYNFGDDDSIKTYFTVVGVVEDFHLQSLHDAIEPSIIILDRDNPDYLAIRLNPGNTDKSIEQLRQKWEEVEHAFPFDYFFTKERYQKLYKSEQKMADLFITFTILAMLIACLGLFGLALFSIEQRTKEIGIRKILGASVSGLLCRLSKEFTKWILISAVVAWLVAYFLVDKWLQSFAYSIEVLDYAWIFIVSALIALVIALGTIIYHAYHAATRDPVDAVKWE